MLMFFLMKIKLFILFFLSNQSFNDCLDLLLISIGLTSHYMYIKDFNRLMFNKKRHEGKKYFLKSCLQYFSIEKSVDRS